MIEVIKKAARQAGDILLKRFKSDLTIRYKRSSHKALVTQADIEAQRKIQQVIIKELIKKGVKNQEIGFIGEENLNRPGKHTFVIDPLDGTTNFASEIEHFAVSIAYYFEGKPIAGLVYQPTRNNLYQAMKSKGAHLNGQKLNCFYKPLKEALVNTYFGSPTGLQKSQFEVYRKIFPQVRAFRNFGCATLDLSSVATNVFNVYLNGHLFLWDISAASIIAKESGAVVVDWQGKPIATDLAKPIQEFQILSAHPNLVKEIIKIIS